MLYLPIGQYALCVVDNWPEAVWKQFSIDALGQTFSLDFVPALREGTLTVINLDIGLEDAVHARAIDYGTMQYR
jgi:hypothetical protein